MTELVPCDFRSVSATLETVVKEIAVPAKVALRNDLRDKSSEGVVICGGRYHTNCLRVHCNSQTQGAVIPVEDIPSQAVVMRVDPEKYLQVAGRFNVRDDRCVVSRGTIPNGFAVLIAAPKVDGNADLSGLESSSTFYARFLDDHFF